LLTLLTQDDRFRDPQTSAESYADAWALNFYLLKTKRRQYVRYLKELAAQTPLLQQTSEQRLALFRRVFEEDLTEFSQQWQRYMLRLR
jgi:hypothetical protein